MRGWNLQVRDGYGVVLVVSVAMLAGLCIFISSRCGQIFREAGPAYDCGIGIGWIAVMLVLVVLGGYSLYRLCRERAG